MMEGSKGRRGRMGVGLSLLLLVLMGFLTVWVRSDQAVAATAWEDEDLDEDDDYDDDDEYEEHDRLLDPGLMLIDPKNYENYSRIYHVVQHTHWDREWYMSFEEYRKRLVWLIDNLLDAMDDDPYFRHFHLDGQTQVVLDYMAVRSPSEGERLLHAIRNGRFSHGPWTTSPDEFLASPEALVRNILASKLVAETYDLPWSRVGYMADTFGHISQLPQLWNLVGISVVYYARGLPDEPLEHYWKGSDGSMVFGAYGQYCHANLEFSKPDTVQTYHKFANVVNRRGPKSSHVPLLMGCDHTTYHPQAVDLLKRMNNYTASSVRAGAKPDGFVVSSLDEYFEEALNGIREGTLLTVYEGELRYGMRHLSFILSNKASQKRANWRCQTQIEKYAEPLRAIGFASGLLKDYEHGLFGYAWSQLFQNHAHDSIGGCSATSVHVAVDNRFRICEEVANQLTNEGFMQLITRRVARMAYLRRRAHRLSPTPSPDSSPNPQQHRYQQAVDPHMQTFSFVVYNPLPTTRRDLVVVMLKDTSRVLRIENVFYAVDRQTGKRYPMNRLMQDTNGGNPRWEIPNFGWRTSTYQDVYQHFITEVEVPGLSLQEFEVEIVPLTTSQHTVPANSTFQGTKPAESLCVLESTRIRATVDGKLGTVDILDKKTGIVHKGLNRMILGQEHGHSYDSSSSNTIASVTSIQLVNEVKTAVVDSCTIKMSLSSPGVNIAVQTTYTLARHARRLDVRLSLDHTTPVAMRLRAGFPTNQSRSKLRVDSHFDLLDSEKLRDTLYRSMSSKAEPQLNFVDIIDDEGNGYTVANRALYEYQKLQDFASSTEYVYVTLLRTSRSLRDWIELNAHTTYDLGHHDFEYAIAPHGPSSDPKNDDWQGGIEGRAFNAPLSALQVRRYVGTLVSDIPLNDLTKSVLARISDTGIKPQAPGDKFVEEQSSDNSEDQEDDDDNEETTGILDLSPVRSLVLSAFKKSERDNSLIVRFYSIESTRVKAKLIFNSLPITGAYRCNLLEERMPEDDVVQPRVKRAFSNRKVELELFVAPREIVTLELELNNSLRRKILKQDHWSTYFNDYPLFDLNAPDPE